MNVNLLLLLYICVQVNWNLQAESPFSKNHVLFVKVITWDGVKLAINVTCVSKALLGVAQQWEQFFFNFENTTKLILSYVGNEWKLLFYSMFDLINSHHEVKGGVGTWMDDYLWASCHCWVYHIFVMPS